MNQAQDLPSPPAILVVEDEAMLRMVAVETMRDAGYVVYEAGEGFSALKILEEQPDIALILSDVKMPGMNGYQLAIASFTLRPSVKILLMTGYYHEAVPTEITKAGVPILRKPFDVDRLPELAKELLGRIGL